MRIGQDGVNIVVRTHECKLVDVRLQMVAGTYQSRALITRLGRLLALALALALVAVFTLLTSYLEPEVVAWRAPRHQPLTLGIHANYLGHLDII